MEGQVSPTLQSLPEGGVSEILVKTTNNNLLDFFSARKACRMLNEAGSDPFVYRNISLEHLVEVGWLKPVVTEEDRETFEVFLERCANYGNLEALYERGLGNVFKHQSLGRVSVGVQALTDGTNLGSAPCRYILAILCLLTTRDALRRLGREIIREIMSSPNVLSECREKIKRSLGHRWLFDRAIWRHHPKLLCAATNHPRCTNRWDMLVIVKGVCLVCQCDLEVATFLGLFPTLAHPNQVL